MEVWLEDHQILSDFGSSWTLGDPWRVGPHGGPGGVGPGSGITGGPPVAVCNDGERLKVEV